jgi:hypothetical protein
MDGFYAAYLTGRGGNSLVLFAVKANSVVGVDVGGMKYDGSIEVAANGDIQFHVRYTIPPGTPLITGVGGVGAPTPVSLDFILPKDFAAGTIVTIHTAFGLINAKINKLRDFDFATS